MLQKFNNDIPKFSVSNFLIIISAIVTAMAMILFDFLYGFGMSRYFIEHGAYPYLVIQFVLYSFLHGGIFHLLFNSLFLFLFGNTVENHLGKNKTILFFIFSTIFTGIFILLLSDSITIGISGYAMALLTYYTLALYDLRDPDYKGGITAIVINILFGLTSDISFVGHLFGAISGGIYYIISEKFLGKK